MKERLAPLISGGGTTMAEIIKAVQKGTIPDMEIACVIASTKQAGGIQKALDLGIYEQKIVVVDPDDFRGSDLKVDRAAFGVKILEALRKHRASIVTQNGWMPRTPVNVIHAYRDRIFNQHPGPPAEFGGKGMYGRRVHAAVLRFRQLTNRDFWTTVIGQKVHENFDEGKVVKAKRVPILPSDTVEDLQMRALPEEHWVQIAMLQDVMAGRLRELEPEFLVRPEERHLLEQAKREAIEWYPKG